MPVGYYSQPTISQTQIAFISDDDLWTVPREGGEARRLTANKGIISSPCFSPNGRWIAFISTDSTAEGDVYLVPAEGGEAERLTWLGVNKISSWKDNKTIYFTSGIEGYPRRETHVYELNIETHDFKKIDLGPATYYYKNKDTQILARHSGDSARWKRYQGGTAGVLWAQRGQSPFKRIHSAIKTNITKPEVVGEKIYFITDHEGVANIYSSGFDGRGLKRHTDHVDYYCRHLRACEDALVYQCGAEIYTYSLESGQSEKVRISCATTGLQAATRYENWAKNFDNAALHPVASELELVTRGHLLQLPPYDGVVKEFDLGKDIRYTHITYNFDGKQLLAVGAHAQSDEKLYLFNSHDLRRTDFLPDIKWGKIWALKSSPKSDQVALINNKKEVYILDLKKKSARKIDTNKYGRQSEPDWSADGRYLAFSAPVDARRSGIYIYDTELNKLRLLLNPVCQDFSPAFDPESKYLYFLGVREFAPNYNETHFDLGFPFAIRPYVVSLQPSTASPFDAGLENPKAVPESETDKESKKSKAKKNEKLEIDFTGIENRIMAFGKLELGGYHKIMAMKGGVLYWKSAVAPITSTAHYMEPTYAPLYQYKFEEGSAEVFHKNVSFVTQSFDKNQLLLMSDSKLRLLDPKTKPSAEGAVGKKDGWLNTDKIKLQIDPKAEWRQMYHEAWMLQQEHFWRKDMTQVDWNLVYKRYLPLLEKVKARTEFSDLMWEMQGELGTSHCYEMGGDYKRYGSGIALARLGAYFDFDQKSKTYVIRRILRGDSWLVSADSPLTAMGVHLEEGDRLYALNGVSFGRASDLYRMLENQAAQKVELHIRRKKGAKNELVTVRTNRTLGGALYRDWVESNKKFIHEKSNGRIGYVHIPDMGSAGYAEFYRHFTTESQFDGLVVDVRYNGGGHVSQHLLKVLAQKVIGFDETRYQGIEKYPMYAAGALVALANEHSGSDGDIFPHSFKLMKLGKLIGKRTWGGIIGINGQYTLRDGARVTQPEYSFWFKDNEWYVENHGVSPDIELEITPENYRDGEDPQLVRALTEVLKELKQNPGTKFKPTYYPDLSTPKKLAKLNR